MIISCVRCGYAKNINHTGTSEEIEQSVYETIQEGWRFDKRFDEYVCPKCKKGYDPYHELAYGKVKKASKIESYRKLMFDMCEFLNAFEKL